MRVISGKFKGLNLSSFEEDHIRPTMDRVKETWFNIISGNLPNAKCLDLFAGTGSLGIEALSRGVDSVLFVEKNPRSIAVLENNLSKLKMTKKSNQIRILRKDVLSFVKAYEEEIFDLIFVDPPFTEKMGHDVLEALDKSRLYNSDTVIMIETSTRERLDKEYSNLVMIDQRKFGDILLSFFKKKSATLNNTNDEKET